MTPASHKWRIVVFSIAAVVLLGGITVMVMRLPALTLHQTDFDRVELTMMRGGSPATNERVTVRYGGVELRVTTNAEGRTAVTFPEGAAKQIEARKFPASTSLQLTTRDHREEPRCTATIPNYFVIDLRCRRIRSKRLWPPARSRYERTLDEPLTGPLGVELGSLSKPVESTNGVASVNLTRNEAHQLVRARTLRVRLGNSATEVPLRVVPLTGEVILSDRKFTADSALVVLQNRTLDCADVRVRAGYVRASAWEKCFFTACYEERSFSLQPGQESNESLSFREPLDLEVLRLQYVQRAEIASAVRRPCTP